MKATACMSARVIGICMAIGCLAGAIFPLPGRNGTPDHPPAVSYSRTSAPSTAPSPGMNPDDLKGVTAAEAAAAAATDPRGFFHRLLKADPQPPKAVLEAFFTGWIERNPDAAFHAALLLPARFGYEVESSQFFPRQVQLLFWRDPMTALRWVGRIEGVIGHDISLHTRVDQLDKLRQLVPEEVRTWLNRTPVGGVSAGMAKSFAEALAARDPVAAIRWAESLNADYQNAVLPMMIHRLSKKDPQAAMDYIRHAPSNIRQYTALFATTTGSPADTLEQMKWLDEEMGVTSYTGINNLLARLYRGDSRMAVENVAAMAGTTQGVDAARGLGEAACLFGPTSAAVSMIATLPPSLQTDAARSAMLFRMPGDFPAFLEPLADGSIKGANLDTYIQLLVDFVDGERGSSFGRAQITWTVAELPQHLEAFQKWIADHPGPERNRFIRQAADALQDKPELRNKVFGNLPQEEIKRIMEGR